MALRGTLTHWKTRTLASMLSVPPCYALGLLEALWHTTAELAPAGNIGRLPNRAIAMEMFYDGDPDKLVNALCESGHLDKIDGGRLYVHDWQEHSDDATDNKLARSGLFYANGAQPRMRRMEKSERAKLCARYGYSVRTDEHGIVLGAHEVPLPVPVPVPEPVPVPFLKQEQTTTLAPTASAAVAGPKERKRKVKGDKPVDIRHTPFRLAYETHNIQVSGSKGSWDGHQANALSGFLAATPDITLEYWQKVLENRARSDIPQGELLSKWVADCRRFWKCPLDRFGKPRETQTVVERRYMQ